MRESTKCALMSATSAVAIAIALPGVAIAQASKNASPQVAIETRGNAANSEISGLIEDLKKAKTRLENASADDARSISTSVTGKLERLKAELGSSSNTLERQRRVEMQDAIEKALSAFEKEDAKPQQKAASLEPVISGLQKIAGNRSGTTGTARAGASSPAGDNRSATNDPGSRQAKGDITVKQQSPKVAVKQPAPRVQVQQPAPKVVIQQPKPEVIINQPKPEVTIKQAKPKVTVEKSGDPKVTIEQGGKPDVEVSRDEGRPGNSREAAKPGSGREQTFGQLQPGQKESAEAGKQQARGDRQPSNDTARHANASPVNPDLERIRGMGRTLVGKTIYGSNNDDIGEIENVVMKNGKATAVLLDVGGFLGLGQRRVAIPLEKLKFEQGRLTTSMTEREVEELEPYRQ